MTLEAYAMVCSAIAAGTPLDDALAAHAIEPSAWALGSSRWAQRVTDAVATDAPLAARYDEVLAAARAQYGRRIRPLDEDFAAWLAFEQRFIAHPEPLGWVRELGLDVRDVGLLHRLWSSRIEQNPTLQERAFAIRRAEPAALPPITVETRAVAAAPTREPAAAMPLDPKAGGDAAEALPPLCVPLPAWERDAVEVKPTVEVLREEPGSEAVPSAPAAPSSLPSYLLAQRGTPARDLRATSAFVAPKGPALPFARGRSAPPSISQAQPKPEKRPVPDSLRGTSLAVAVPRGEALPFANVAKGDLRGTALALDVPASVRAPLPFAPSQDGGRGSSIPAAPALPAAPGASAPPQPKRPAGLAGTALAIESSGPALPFAPGAATREGGSSAAKLTLEQYASLCAELAVAPQDAPTIRERYGLPSEAAFQAIDSQWQARFLFDNAARTQWLELTERYRRWLAAR